MLMQGWTSVADDDKDDMARVHVDDEIVVVGVDIPLEPLTWVKMQYDDRRNDQ